MLNCIVVVSIIGLFIAYEILLRIARALFPGRAFRITQTLVWRIVRHIFNIMNTYAGVRLEYEDLAGRELPERFLLVTNHQSLFDIPLLIALFPQAKLRFVAKKELGAGIPFVSLILRCQGHALIARKGDATRAMRAILRMARRCEREGTCPVIFPEGTRSLDGEVGVFHTAGVRKILDVTPLPIVVAALDGGWRVAKVRDAMNNLQGARFRVRVLAVTPTLSSKREVLAALEKARAEIASGLSGMRKAN
jgi:1-acyl-sn-glycerol-3-phosphate acyltransferase